MPFRYYFFLILLFVMISVGACKKSAFVLLIRDADTDHPQLFIVDTRRNNPKEITPMLPDSYLFGGKAQFSSTNKKRIILTGKRFGNSVVAQSGNERRLVVIATSLFSCDLNGSKVRWVQQDIDTTQAIVY